MLWKYAFNATLTLKCHVTALKSALCVHERQVCTYDSDTHQHTYLSEESFSLIKAKSIHNSNTITITPDPTHINTNNT